ncbi:MAG: exo-alpha-sialidase, partial [Ignavibacteria bacterium]|nr:exo-alpha-sialidase [Ignavibacteria bacterium]
MKSKLVLIVVMVLFCNLSKLIGQVEDLPQLLRFPFQDSTSNNYCQSQPLIRDNEILIFYSVNNSPQDTILLTKSSDNGENWSAPIYVSNLLRDRTEIVFISGTISNTGRILVVFSIGEVGGNNKTKIVHSDDNGLTWSTPQNVIGVAYIPYPKITKTMDGKLWIVGRNNYFFYSTNNGDNWVNKNLGFSTSTISAFDFIELDSANYLTTYDKYDTNTDTYKIYYRKSTDAGSTWTAETIITETDRSEKRPNLFQESNGTIWLVIQNRESTPFSITYNIYQQNISYRKCTDNGNVWSSPTNFTSYFGYDGTHNICS